MMNGSALRAEGIGVSFGGLRALHRVNVDVAPGEIVGVIGPNGAGKTTLFDCISGFVPCRGKVSVGDVDVTHKPPHERAAAGLGRSFQDARLFHTMSVFDTLRMASELRMRHADALSSLLSLPSSRTAERGASERASQLVDLMGLGAYRDKLIKELSTGTRRIVDLACVLIQRPKIVLLDEPSSGIAQREAEALGPLLVSLRDRLGCALLVIEHDMPLLLGIAERVYALETGIVVTSGEPLSVVRHPEVVRSYLGDDPAAIERSGAARRKKVRS
ncbi:MAG: ATP-binding cassette domain-containing protein [Actinomycetota bacterium]